MLTELQRRMQMNRSQVVRTAIHLLYSILQGTEGHVTGGIVIRNPNIVINVNTVDAKAEARAELPPELVDAIRELYELRRGLPPIQRNLVEKLHKLITEKN